VRAIRRDGEDDGRVGDSLLGLPRTALILHLSPAHQAKFALPPERKPRTEAWYGGALSLLAPSKPGIYQVTVSEEAWIDLVQDGRYAHSIGSTGRSDCPGMRKSVRFELTPAPFALQISGAASSQIAVIIAPAP